MSAGGGGGGWWGRGRVASGTKTQQTGRWGRGVGAAVERAPRGCPYAIMVRVSPPPAPPCATSPMREWACPPLTNVPPRPPQCTRSSMLAAGRVPRECVHPRPPRFTPFSMRGSGAGAGGRARRWQRQGGFPAGVPPRGRPGPCRRRCDGGARARAPGRGRPVERCCAVDQQPNPTLTHHT